MTAATVHRVRQPTAAGLTPTEWERLRQSVAPLSRRDAEAELRQAFPDHSSSWVHTHFHQLLRIDGDQYRRITYPDPTGDTAARRVDHKRNSGPEARPAKNRLEAA